MDASCCEEQCGATLIRNWTHTWIHHLRRTSATLSLGGVYVSNLFVLQYLITAICWIQGHAVQYPTLSHIAQDYLAIPGSSVQSEHAFSSGHLTATKRHNRLTPEVFEALQILKGAYRNSHISAAQDAKAHIGSALDELMSDGDDIGDIVVDKSCVLCMLEGFDCVWFSPRFRYIRTRTGP